MPRIDFSKKKSRLAKRICAWFKEYRNEDLSFGEILDKYCEVGMSRKYVTKILMEIKNTNGDLLLGDRITVKSTPVWEAWMIEKTLNRTEFKFHSKFKGNPFHGNKGQIREKKNTFIFREKLTKIKYICLKCDCHSEDKIKITSDSKRLIALKAFCCPVCGEYETTVARFILDGKKFYKEITDGREQFVENNETISVEKEIYHGENQKVGAY